MNVKEKNTDAPSIELEDAVSPGKEEKQKKVISTKLLVDCKSETELSLLFSELQDRGFKVVLK